jgi:hypothetical protein
MAFDTNLAVRIATVLDATGLRNADKGIKSLEKTTKRLGRTLGISLSTAAVVAYGKASVKAFAADEAAAIRLSNAVDNLGISFANPAISKFISELESTAGVADDVLRPAFQALLTQTGSLTQSQKLLNDAITISRASGVDLATVSSDLAKGYVGITRGLQKYNTGLSKSELQTKSFSEVLGILLQQSSGAANAYLATTSFKFDVLTVAAGNAQEAIGEGLVNALARAGGGTEAKDAVATINAIAKGINSITLAVGTAVGGLTSLINIVKNLPGDVFAGFAGAKGGINSQPTIAPKPKTVPLSAQQKALAKLEKDAVVRAKKFADAQTKATKALTAEQKKQAMSKKQSALFDLEQIGLLAALKGNLSKEEELRVKLQLALLTENTTEADKLSKQLAFSIDSTGKLAAYLSALPDAKNPFLGWDEWLKNFTKNLATVTGSTIPTTGGGVSPAPVTSVPSSNAMPANVFNTLGSASTKITPEAYGNLYRGMGSSQPTIVVQIDGKAIASSLQDQNLSGVDSTVNRLLGQFR